MTALIAIYFLIGLVCFIVLFAELPEEEHPVGQWALVFLFGFFLWPIVIVIRQIPDAPRGPE